jgi:hypothetical protein
MTKNFSWRTGGDRSKSTMNFRIAVHSTSSALFASTAHLYTSIILGRANCMAIYSQDASE